MTTTKRRNGRLFRKTLRLNAAWIADGKREGRIENDLAWRLGQCARAGMGPAMARARRA